MVKFSEMVGIAPVTLGAVGALFQFDFFTRTG
jgi:hypothetical protein